MGDVNDQPYKGSDLSLKMGGAKRVDATAKQSCEEINEYKEKDDENISLTTLSESGILFLSKETAHGFHEPRAEERD